MLNNLIFKLVSNLLQYLAKKTRLSYVEINIIVYYFIIPFTWIILIDMLLNSHYLKLSFMIFTAGFRVGCQNFGTYSIWLFKKSVDFLNYFNRYGSNYVKASVRVCVLVPITIYVILIYLILK